MTLAEYIQILGGIVVLTLTIVVMLMQRGRDRSVKEAEERVLSGLREAEEKIRADIWQANDKSQEQIEKLTALQNDTHTNLRILREILDRVSRILEKKETQ